MDFQEAWAGLLEGCDSCQPRLTWSRRGSLVACSSSFWFWSLECCFGCDTLGSKQASAKPQNIFNYRKPNVISPEYHKPAESWVRRQYLSEILAEVLTELLRESSLLSGVMVNGSHSAPARPLFWSDSTPPSSCNSQPCFQCFRTGLLMF